MTNTAKARYMQNAGSFFPTTDEAMNIKDQLPAGNYVIAITPQKQLYFERVADFELPPKFYGDTASNACRILHTFNDRPSSTGVLLTGEKGSGKTLLAKVLCTEAAKFGIPTVIINSPWVGDEFNKLIQDIQQPCIILFDEFEKVYDREHQEKVLTLLDGVFPSKKLFIVTCNDKFRIDDNMNNRPGRLYYALEYKGLNADFISAYCKDVLKDQSHIDSICTIASTFDQFNFDLLKALVEEMNRYGEDPFDAIKMLNASPTKDKEGRYAIELIVCGRPTRSVYVESRYDGENTLRGNPCAAKLKMSYQFADAKEDDGDDPEIYFDQNQLIEIKPLLGKFVYDDGNGSKVTFTRIVENDFNYSTLAKFHAF